MNITNKDFFWFHDKWASSKDIQAICDDVNEKWNLILGNYEGIKFPLIFKVFQGTRWNDVVNTGWPSLYLISERMKNLLEENNLTGWQTFPVKVLDKKDNEITGYYGFSVTGRCNALLDYRQSPIIEKQYIANGPIVKFYKGVFFNIDSWDKSDFFFTENYYAIFITKKVSEILKKNKIIGLELENLADWEMNVRDVK